MGNTSTLKLGTRGSALAKWQAGWVAHELQKFGLDVEIIHISTAGDRQSGPIQNIGAQGLFTKELQRALLDKRIDLAVHSLKDLPTDVVPGLCLGSVPRRAAVADVLVSPKHTSLESLPKGATIGTGSLRRQAQLLNFRADLQMRDIRGNVQTRLQKVQDGEFDAIILAEAGLRRLGLEENITEQLPLSLCMPAIAQGALGIEIRQHDDSTRSRVELLSDPPSQAAAVAERSMLATLRGGCLAPIAAWGRIENDRLKLTGRVLERQGRQKLETTLDANPADPTDLGRQVAEKLLSQGAAALIEESRADN